MKLVEFILILYFDEDHRSFMIIFGIWKKKYWEFIFFLQVILYFGFDHRAVVMLSDFR